MSQEKVLDLILDKLNAIEKEQLFMKENMASKSDIKKIDERLEKLETGQEKLEIGQEKLEAGQELIKKDLAELKSIQNNIKSFVMSTEKVMETYDKDHQVIEKLKLVLSE